MQTGQMILQALILIGAVSGIGLNIYLSPNSEAVLNLFSYFTIQSNFWVAVAMVWAIISAIRKKEPSKMQVIFQSGTTLWILVTGLVYHFLLSATRNPQGLNIYTNLVLHYLVPLAMVVLWIGFSKKGQYRYPYVLFWIGYPLLYSLVTEIRGAFTDYYPYWFLNPKLPRPDGIGSIEGVLMIVGGLTALFAVIGVLIVFVDNRLAKLSRKN